MGKSGICSIQKRRERNELLVDDGSSSDSSESGDTIVPPDGGWGWMVVLSSFMIHVIADGIVYSFGVFLMEFVVYFKSGRSAASLIGALQPAVTFTVGPIASVLTSRYGCRKVTIAGALIAAAGFVMSTFAPHLYYLYFTSGIMAGIGFGLIYLPAIVCVAQYFKKRRSFATGLAVCGSGFGTFILAPLIEMLVHRFSWQGAMLILAGVILNVTVCGIIFRPLKAGENSRTTTSPDSEDESLSGTASMSSVSQEHESKHYILQVKETVFNEEIIAGQYPFDGEETGTSRALTNHRKHNINNSLQRLSTKTKDTTVCMVKNNCSNSSNNPSTFAFTEELGEYTSDPNDANNSEESSESAASSEKDHPKFESQNDVHEIKHIRYHNPDSSHSLDYLLQVQKQDSNVGLRNSQSADNILHNSKQSIPSGSQNSWNILSRHQIHIHKVFHLQHGNDTSSVTSDNQAPPTESQGSMKSSHISHEQQNTESDFTNYQNSTPNSHHSRHSSSRRHSSQNTLSNLHAKFKSNDDIISQLSDSSSTLSEQQHNQVSLSGDQGSQQHLSDGQKSPSSVSDLLSTHCLVSQQQHAADINVHSDSVLHLQSAPRYKLRTGVLAPKSKSHSCLVAYKPLRCKDALRRCILQSAPLHYRPKQDVYTTATSVPNYVMSRFSEKEENKHRGCLGFSQDLCVALKNMMALSLLKNPVFLMFAVSNFLTSLGFNGPFIFLPDRAKQAGIDEKNAALLLSWIGIANTVGRVVFGFLSDRSWVNRLLLYNTALTICGVVTALSPLVGGDYALLVTYATIFGVFIGVYVSLTSIVLVDLLGLEYLTKSFGLLLLFQGAATFVGPPFAGWLCDWTGSYDTSFVVMGCLVAASGAMLYFLPLVERYQAQRLVIPDTGRDIELGQNPMTRENGEIFSKSPIITVV
ncbi:hypothetical protein BsWGS_03645 [Bradybaena similaris]